MPRRTEAEVPKEEALSRKEPKGRRRAGRRERKREAGEETAFQGPGAVALVFPDPGLLLPDPLSSVIITMSCSLRR